MSTETTTQRLCNDVRNSNSMGFYEKGKWLNVLTVNYPQFAKDIFKAILNYDASQAQIAELKAIIEREVVPDIKDKEIAELKEQLKEARGVAEFYGSPKNWTSGEDEMRQDKIVRSDVADYPHITRDVRLTGGKLARAYLLKYPSEG